ncbi:competence type IV pilus major pilin ComGC [Oceanobacillus sp. CAU 1775]
MLKNEKGFTLVEMLVVMLIITVLLLIIIPNISDQSKAVNDKGCNALIAMVQAQADAFYFEEGAPPTSIEQLENKGFITNEQTKCNDKTQLSISKGIVQKNENNN